MTVQLTVNLIILWVVVGAVLIYVESARWDGKHTEDLISMIALSIAWPFLGIMAVIVSPLVLVVWLGIKSKSFWRFVWTKLKALNSSQNG